MLHAHCKQKVYYKVDQNFKIREIWLDKHDLYENRPLLNSMKWSYAVCLILLLNSLLRNVVYDRGVLVMDNSGRIVNARILAHLSLLTLLYVIPNHLIYSKDRAAYAAMRKGFGLLYCLVAILSLFCFLVNSVIYKFYTDAKKSDYFFFEDDPHHLIVILSLLLVESILVHFFNAVLKLKSLYRRNNEIDLPRKPKVPTW